MSSANYVIIQTALRPITLVTIEGTDYHAVDVADYAELFVNLNNIALAAETKLLVNRGPGSYTGIRTGIAYAYGLLHGKVLKKEQVLTYTSFDYVRAATSHNGPIFLKSWPRIETGKTEGSRGYFEKSGEISYKPWEDISEESDLLIVSEEELTTDHEFRTYADLLHDAVGFRELANRSEQLSDSLDPLYINPVHIT